MSMKCEDIKAYIFIDAIAKLKYEILSVVVLRFFGFALDFFGSFFVVLLFAEHEFWYSLYLSIGIHTG